MKGKNNNWAFKPNKRTKRKYKKAGINPEHTARKVLTGGNFKNL